ncbi:MAG: TIGR04076 family protein [Bacteroidales bacterium]|nr:TIGR04076 family protein [Bacteroidales bacterium]
MDAQATTTHAVRITALRKADYKDLQQLLEKPIEDACLVDEGQTWTSHRGERPDGFCPTAWETLQWFVAELAAGRGGFYGDWMKNPGSALISCNDGFRPVSFLLERIG